MNAAVSKVLGAVIKPVLKSMGKRRLADHQADMRLPGLKGEVEVRRDAQGVPHLFAAYKADVFFAQGFVHCQDRLWQMEVNRRLALGRISEVFGKVALDTDRMSRTFGFSRLAFQDLQQLDPDLVQLLQAYCDGVNACLGQLGKKLPVEFALAGYKPEPWTVQHVLAFARLMTMQLSFGWGHELSRARMVQALGPELAAELDLRYGSDQPITLPDGLLFQELTAEKLLRSFEGPFFNPVTGSNAWALSGSKTDTGKPYLCSDPHLFLTMPGIWYQCYLEAPGYRVQGVSIPGMPLVLIGHNAKIGWGITLSYTDIQDVFVERFDTDEQKTYLSKGEWLPCQVVEEKIKIKGKPEVHIEKVRTTHHGTVISDALQLPLSAETEHKLVLCSPALRSNSNLEGWYRLNLADGWNDFVQACDQIGAPGLNIVYGDVSGNIGYRMTGDSPIRAAGIGDLPQPGWDGTFDWVGMVPKKEMPSTLNPSSGVVVSANHKVVADDYPYFLGRIWMNGYRAKRIEALLAEQQVWGRDDFRRIHMDVFCQPGLHFAAHFKNLTPLNPFKSTENQLLQRLLSWDGYLTVDTVGGTIYQVCKRMMMDLIFQALTGTKEDQEWMMGKGMEPIFLKVSEFQGKDTEAVLAFLSAENAQVIAKAGGKARLLEMTVRAAAQWLENKLGRDLNHWKWGRLHQIEFPHPMSVQKPLDRVFNVGPIPIYGDTDTVCQTSMQPHEPFAANMALPSYRQIIDFNDFNKSVWVMPPGQSGQISSPHERDQVAAWFEGRYFPMLWDREQVEKATVQRQVFQPM